MGEGTKRRMTKTEAIKCLSARLADMSERIYASNDWTKQRDQFEECLAVISQADDDWGYDPFWAEEIK